MRHARDSRLAGARPNLQNYFGWLAPAPGRIGMMRNIFPHGKIDVPSEVVAAGPSLVAPGVSGVHRDFQRVQDLYHNKHEPAGRRLRRARIIRARIITACHIDSAVGDTPTGLGVVEIAKLPDKPPQTLVALAPPPTLETGQRPRGAVSQTRDPCVHDRETAEVLRIRCHVERRALAIDRDRTCGGRVKGAQRHRHRLCCNAQVSHHLCVGWRRVQRALEVTCDCAELLHCRIVVAVSLKTVHAGWSAVCGASQAFRYRQAKGSRQTVEPRHQQVELVQQQSQRRHPLRSRRTEVVLMPIAVIPPSKLAQGLDDASPRTAMPGQQEL